ncbi:MULTISPECIES: GNAT family N-acetyltransferase [unclassified Streptomyces]|uniref:GNAT family N-acetyltransferase n=1 Tax=unclassified Streptomyces TaxID=2593676 RepID=UPI0022508433|nr:MULTISPECIES: GNAT family N-acetyltransferase [unclassified Streptomyces]MCX5061362.1 GNAT family N-acetyltransferase [Streptomyces sp. NBC_00452]MCX5293010.1 GNAT family N-acetyltransferase [Streptomyces sp. NBC_00183]
MDEAVRAWVHGWVVSRRAGPPMEEPWGWTVDVGLVDQVSRHVFGATNDDVDEDTVRKVAGAVTGAGVWLKVFRDPSVAREWVGAGWWVDPEPGYLMTIPLTGAEETEVPYGHRLRSWTRGGVTTVLVAAPDGSLAARGQIATNGATAVADRIETAPAHRRRGLGSVVMRTLQRTAAEQGAETGVLAGTPAGRALYEALGWRTVAPLTSAKFVGPAGRP